MNRIAFTRVVLIAGILALAGPSDAGAQLGGLKKLKKAAQDRAAEAVLGKDPPKTAAAAGAARSGENVVEMTPAVLDLVARLATQGATGDEGRTADELVAAHEAWTACVERLQEEQRVRAQGIGTRLQQAALAGDARKIQALQDSLVSMQNEGGAVCGAEPDLDAVERRREEERARHVAALAAAGLTDVQYGVLVERIVPFCTLHARSGSGQAQIPGSGKNIYYVYGPGEIEALAPRCATLLPALQAKL